MLHLCNSAVSLLTWQIFCRLRVVFADKMGITHTGRSLTSDSGTVSFSSVFLKHTFVYSVFIQVIDGDVTRRALIGFVLCNPCLNQLVLGFPPGC